MSAPDLTALSTRRAPQPSRARRRRAAVLTGGFGLSCAVIAIVAPLPYLTKPLSVLASADTGLARHYAAQAPFVRRALLVHAAAGGLALLLAPAQTARWVRSRLPAVHRALGTLSAAAILLAAASGLVIAQVSYAGIIGRFGFSALAVAWASAVTLTVRDARRGDRAGHRAWATRTLALTYAAVTLRLWMVVFVAVQRPATDVAARAAFDRTYPIVPFLCWVPNLLVAEWIIRRRPLRRAR